MVDKLLHEIFARGLDLGLDDAALAAMLSLSWHRMLLGCDPLEADASLVSRG